LTWRESLRDIETCLASFGPKLYHSGIRGSVIRNKDLYIGKILRQNELDAFRQERLAVIPRD